MQLLRLEVRNWVHHRYRVCEFTRGLVAILGENGSGKSSLFGALRWLLTGENPNYGVKTDNISQYAKEGEPSYASLEFEHGGHVAIVTRHLLPEKEQSTFTIDGVEAGRGDKAVTAAIERFLGVDAKFISRFIIVGQTDIFSFIDDSQSETDKFFQRLFNTAKADKCQDLLGKNVAKISIPEVIHTASELQAKIDQCKEAVTALETQAALLPTVDQFFQLQQEDQEIVKAGDALGRVLAELAKLVDQEVALNNQLVSLKAEGEQHETDLAALEAASSGQESAITAARTALGHWASYKSILAAKAKLDRDRAALEAQRAKLPPEPLAVDPAERDKLNARQSALVAERERAGKFVTTFTRAGVAACPTCHTSVANLADHIEEQRAFIATCDKEISEIVVQRADWEKRSKEYQRWKTESEMLDGYEKQLTAAEARLTDIAQPAASEEELNQTVADYESFQGAIKAIAPLAQAAKVKRAQTEGLLTSLLDRRKKLETERDANTVTQTDVDLANARLDQLRVSLSERTTLESEIVSARFNLKEAVAEHARAVADEIRAAKSRQWVSLAEKARDALKNAPRMVAQRNLQKLEASINDLLQVFGVNFQVKVSEDGSPTFIAEFYDGRKQVAQRLSIGQKTVLAIAFRVAVNAMYAEEIGLLALDEPTASLDAPRIRALAPVLEKLRELSTSKGLQCLLVTHAASLSNLFESAIELEPPELRHSAQPA
jgi:DNA repair exonuclease SbcCD ATPase subunit